MDLPPGEQAHLLSLSAQLPALRSRVRSLRAAGWTLASIGAPLAARRSTVRSWENHPVHSPLPDSPPVPLPPLPPAPHPHPSAASARPRPSSSDLALIQRLAPRARRARAGTPPSSDLARSRVQLNDLVRTLYNQGVPISVLASAAGVTYRAMSVRIKQSPPPPL